MLQHLPEERDMHRLPRQFVVNVLYTILGDQVADWVKSMVETRNSKLAEKRKMLLDLDPEIA